MGISVEVVADSISPDGVRLTTVQVDIPRFILAQLNTHRVFSSNAQSSRAVPTEILLKQVRENPAIPVFWGKNRAGMSADGVECDNLVGISGWPKEREEAWRNAANEAAYYAAQFAEAGYHKEIVNRLVEPFMWTRVVVSATEWDNFYFQRCDRDAQPDMDFLAQLIRQRIRSSYPHRIRYNQWHTPYFANGWWTPESNVPLVDALKISVSCCAQVSYRKLDDSLEKAEKIFDMLHLINSDRPPHCFDRETEVMTINGFKYWPNVTEDDLLMDININTGEMMGFSKPLNLIRHNYTGRMFTLDTDDISFKITEGHTILGAFGKNSRGKLFESDVRKCSDISHGTEAIKQQVSMLTSPFVDGYVSARGQFIGFYIGDGRCEYKCVYFHIKKKRKIEYLENLLGQLNMEYTKKEGWNGAFVYRVSSNQFIEEVVRKCGNNSGNKRIGKWDIPDYVGIFDGLKNSDGSIKRKTWSYSTTSEELKNDFLNYSYIAGLTSSENKQQNGAFKLMVKTKTKVMLNDSRKPESFVQEEFVENSPVYCATMPSGGLLVRRKGNTLVTGNCSPAEHCATPISPNASVVSADKRGQSLAGISHKDMEGEFWSGNFRGWSQLRKQIEQGCSVFNEHI